MRMRTRLEILLFLSLSFFMPDVANAKVVIWKAPEVTVKLDIPKECSFDRVYSRKVFLFLPGRTARIIARVMPSMVVSAEEIRKAGGRHHHEPVGTKELAKRLAGTAKAMNGRSASGRTVEVINTKVVEIGEGVWFGEEIYTITDEKIRTKELFCQRIYYSPNFTLSFFLEKRLKKGDDEKAIYGIFQKVADSVSF